MTKEQKDKILKALVEDRNDYARDCARRVAEEQGRISGADYMLQRFLDILKNEDEDICEKCLYAEETDGSHCYECVKGKSKFNAETEVEK